MYERLDLEKLCAGVAQTLKAAIEVDDAHRGRLGFCLLMFDVGEAGSFAYAATAARADVVQLLKEAATKIGATVQ